MKENKNRKELFEVICECKNKEVNERIETIPESRIKRKRQNKERKDKRLRRSILSVIICSSLKKEKIIGEKQLSKKLKEILRTERYMPRLKGPTEYLA